jgi:hypothetical protein
MSANNVHINICTSTIVTLVCRFPKKFSMPVLHLELFLFTYSANIRTNTLEHTLATMFIMQRSLSKSEGAKIVLHVISACMQATSGQISHLLGINKFLLTFEHKLY